MTDSAPTTAVAVREIQNVQNLQPMLDTARFEHFQRASKALMHSSLLPESVRGNGPEQCFSNMMLIFDLSDRWKLPAASIAQGIAIVHNKVVYEGKLIQAMLSASIGVRLYPWYTGERGTPGYRIYLSDKPWDDFSDEQLAEILKPGLQLRDRRVIDGSVDDWRTFQKDGRTPNPAWTGAATRNQLLYRGSREWARMYEPATMVGVYGDDEIDAMTIRMEARDVTPATAPGLSGGFTRPAAAEPETAQVDDPAATATDIVQTAQEAAQDAQVEEPAAAEPSGKAKATEPKRTAKQQKVVDDRREALDTAQKMGAAAEEAALWGNDDLDGLLATCKTDEQRSYVENGYKKGLAARNDELEAAYNNGALGQKMAAPEWLTPGDKSAERRAKLLSEEWERGRAERAAEQAADRDDAPDGVDSDIDGEADESTGNEALDAIREAEPEIVDQALQDDAGDEDDLDTPDAIDAFVTGLANLTDWKSIKSGLSALTKTDCWAQAGADRIARVRAAAWMREAENIEAGRDRMDFINDLTAFRCWAETTTDVDAINGNWQALVRQPIYTNLAPDQQESLQRAILGRIEQISVND